MSLDALIGDSAPPPDAAGGRVPGGAPTSGDAVRALADALRPLDESRARLLDEALHELRSPLTCIVGYLELLADGAPGPLTADQDRMIQVVCASADRLAGLLRILGDGADTR